MITVFLITDEATVRAHLLSTVALEPDMLAIGDADSVMRALEMVPRLKPDVIMIDTDAPGADPAASARLLQAVSPDSAVIALGVPDTWTAELMAREAGVSSYVPDWENGDSLRAAIRRSTFRAA